MQDGRVSFTTEKATRASFYQLSGRRINWDLTDYHPLLAQRAQSTDTFTDDLQPSVDYQQATEIREGLDRNFLIILSDVGAQGRRRRARDVQPFDRPVPGRPHRGDVPALGEDHRPGRDRQGRHRRRLPLAVLAAQRRDPGVLRRRA